MQLQKKPAPKAPESPAEPKSFLSQAQPHSEGQSARKMRRKMVPMFKQSGD